MFNLADFISPWRRATPMNALFAPCLFVDEYLLLTKSTALCAFFEASPDDDECLAEANMENIASRLQSAFRRIDERFTIYQYAIKQGGYEPIERKNLSPACKRTSDRRNEFIRDKGLHEIRIVYALLFEGSAHYVKAGSLINGDVKVGRSALERDIALIRSQAEMLREMVEDVLHLRWLNKREIFTFLRLLANLDSEIAASEGLKYDSQIDVFMASVGLTIAKEEGRPSIRVNHKPVEVITLREPPRMTSPSLLRSLLAIKGEFLVCTQFKRVETQVALAEISSTKKHFGRAARTPDKGAMVARSVSRKSEKREEEDRDESADDDKAESGRVQRRINTDGEYMGMFSLTILLFGRNDRAGLLAMSSQVARILGGLQASTITESYNAANAYLSVIPGNMALDLRRIWLLSSNYADLTFATAPAHGCAESKSLVTLATAEQTPYHLDVEYGGVIGLRLFGARGSGKTATSNLLLDGFQMDEPYTFILDLLGGYRELTDKHDGAYIEMRFEKGEQTFHINPFVIPGTESNRQFLTQFIKTLLRESQFECTGDESERIFRSITSLYLLDEKHRTLGMLSEGLPPRLKKALSPWVGGGQYGTIFDNVVDTLRLARFQTFDFRGMRENYPGVMSPLVFCLFNRIDQVVHDPAVSHRRKLLWLDEAWIFLENREIRDYVVAAAKTWRTANGGVGIVTQSASDQEKLGIFETLAELCPIDMLLASPGANVAAYQKLFKLNDRVAQRFARLIPKRQVLVLTPDGAKVLNVDIDPVALAEYGSSHEERAARSAAKESQLVGSY